ncbi:MAG: hypothetical protein RL681_367 [Candidatus Parcubacteria bacterium]|jgi:glucose/arabinose dehydrogenase
MRKQLLLSIIGMLALGGLIFAAKFAYQYLASANPAPEPAPVDIGDIIDQANNSGNTTGIPLSLPPDFSISVFARDLEGPQVMLWAPDGSLLVSLTDAGKIVALRDENGDGVAETNQLLFAGMNRPHGLTTRCTAEGCVLYVAEANGVFAYDYNERSEVLRSSRRKILDLPNTLADTNYTRALLFRPYPNDAELLISLGSSCNVCNESDERYASVIALNVETGESRQFAKGLRNTAFMSIHPVNGTIWATEISRDMLGASLPPDEINILEDGKNYGWPACYGKNIHDTDFDKNTYVRNPCMDPFETSSTIDIPAHSAPLGIAFVPEEGWPQDWWYNAIVAYHGSSNRSGYKLVRYKLDAQGKYLGEEDFITGWLTPNGGVLGQPSDILIQPGGTMYVSDDKAGVIYRILYRPGQGSGGDGQKSNLIRVDSPRPDGFVQSPLVVTGQARGNWFFEASFPVELFDAQGKSLAIGIAQAQGEWMTEQFVPFKAALAFTSPGRGTGMLVLRKDNPSGLPEHDDELRVPIRFEPPAAGGKGDRGAGELLPCRSGGCSGQLCTDKDMVTTCEYRPEYVCFGAAICERQANGQCGWRMTDELTRCLANPGQLR